MKSTLDSLQNQTVQNFEVIFIDYGSALPYAEEIQSLVNSYPFCIYCYVPVSGKLWSRSKALNIGIKMATHDKVFIVDIDLVFAPNALEVATDFHQPGFYLGGYWQFLGQEDSSESMGTQDFKPKQSKVSDDNGMLFIEKAALMKVHGYDEFFHLYGGEDTDLKYRLELSGFKKALIPDKSLFFHIWHPHVIQKKSKELSSTPFFPNVKRVNEKHVFYNQEQKLQVPRGQEKWGEIPSASIANMDFQHVELLNVQSRVAHFFNYALNHLHHTPIEICIREEADYRSTKKRIKAFLGKQSEPNMTLQEINELITQQLVYNLRDEWYSYEIDTEKQVLTLKLYLTGE